MSKRLTTNDFILKANNVHDNFYDYSKVNYVNNSTKVTITCPLHSHFEQSPNHHLNGSGCKQCKRMKSKYSENEFIQKSKTIWGNLKFDYSKLQYINLQSVINLRCVEHNVSFTQTASTHLSGKHSGCKQCSTIKRASSLTSDTESFILKANNVHDNFYDYSKVNYINAKTKVTITCPLHSDFEQVPASHISGNGCKQCSTLKIAKVLNSNTNNFILKANNIHDNFYDYSKVNYINVRTKVIISCPTHGDFEQVPNYHLSGNGCPVCGTEKSALQQRYQISKQEQEYADYLIELLGSEKVEQSNRTILNGKELDIYLPEHKIAIEYNGIYWHSSGKKEDDAVKRKQHLEKTELCANQGIELLHINEGDNVELWKQVIKNKLGLNKRIYARNTTTRLISNKEANNFLEHNHLQGKCASSINLGLYHENKLLSVMTFGKARYSDADWELIRFCTKGGYTVVGGASKLLKMFRTHNKGVIIGYANKRWSVGNLYEKLGFDYLHDSEPCYWYIKDNKCWHRSKFMKHKLKEELETFDPKLSEVENMYNNKFRRIWDCGNKVYKM